MPLEPVTSHLAALNLFMVNKRQLNRGTAAVPLFGWWVMIIANSIHYSIGVKGLKKIKGCILSSTGW